MTIPLRARNKQYSSRKKNQQTSILLMLRSSSQAAIYKAAKMKNFFWRLYLRATCLLIYHFLHLQCSSLFQYFDHYSCLTLRFISYFVFVCLNENLKQNNWSDESLSLKQFIGFERIFGYIKTRMLLFHKCVPVVIHSIYGIYRLT